MKKELLALICLTTVYGCSMGGGVQVKRVAFVAPKGWAKGESDDKSVTLAIPPGFRQGANSFFGTSSNPFAAMAANDPSSSQMKAEQKKNVGETTKVLDEVAKEDEMKNLDALAKKGIILHCISTGKPVIGEEQTRFYVKLKSQNSNWTWPDVDGSEQDCFKEKQTAKEVKLPIGLAHRMQANWQLQDGSNYTQISYLVPSGRDLYVLRFITVESPEVITTHEKEVADSFRIN